MIFIELANQVKEEVGLFTLYGGVTDLVDDDEIRLENPLDSKRRLSLDLSGL